MLGYSSFCRRNIEDKIIRSGGCGRHSYLFGWLDRLIDMNKPVLDTTRVMTYTFDMKRAAKAISWARVTAALAAVLLIAALALSLWYYLMIIFPRQASLRDQAQVDAAIAKLHAIYCNGEPYPTKNVEAFCTGQSATPSP